MDNFKALEKIKCHFTFPESQIKQTESECATDANYWYAHIPPTYIGISLNRVLHERPETSEMRETSKWE